MAGDDDVGANAPAARVIEGSDSVKVRTFRGNGKDATTVEMWADSVDRVQTLKEWTAERTAAAVCDSLTDYAATFVSILKKNEPDVLTDWTTLRPRLITRFSESKSAVQKMRLVASLTQKQGELCQDFWDRVQYALLEFHEKPRGTIGGAHIEHRRWGYDFAVTTSLAMMFLAGLRPEIRTTLEARMDDDASSDWIRTAAIRAELAMGGTRRGATVAGVSADYAGPAQAGQCQHNAAYGGQMGGNPPPCAHSSTSQASSAPSNNALALELAALSARLTQMTAGGGGNKKSGGKNDRGPPPPMHARTTWFWCYKCQQHGLHTAKECPRTAAEISQLTKMDRRTKPSGPVFDPCFPHLTPNGRAGGST